MSTEDLSPEVIAQETSASRQINATAANDSPNPVENPGIAPAVKVPAPEVKEPAAPLARITAADKVRASIAERFKAGRGQGIDFHGDMRDPSMRYGQYGAPATEGADPEAAEPGIDPVQQPTAPAEPVVVVDKQPTLQKVVVHGVEMWMTPDQVLAEAQKSLAAGNILETAKSIRDATERTAAPPANQPGTDPQKDPNQGPDEYEQLVNDLQFGDPAKARNSLRKTIADQARIEAQKVLTQDRFGLERTSRIRALAEFQAKNPDLAADPYAPAVITHEVNRQYAEDLKAIGVPADQLPKTAAEIADWHMQARVQGKAVRPIEQIFDAAKDRFLGWKGNAKAEPAKAAGPAPQPAPVRDTTPRVELSPERVQRRAQVPIQPTPVGVPSRGTQPIPTPGGDRSSAIMAMRKARGQIVA